MKSKHFVVTNPEISGESVRISDTAPPSDLAGLRAYKASRTPSSIITARRAAQALASSRMAAKVAQDKLEARLAAKVAQDKLEARLATQGRVAGNAKRRSEFDPYQRMPY